jgi:hypothetical protein
MYLLLPRVLLWQLATNVVTLEKTQNLLINSKLHLCI